MNTRLWKKNSFFVMSHLHSAFYLQALFLCQSRDILQNMLLHCLLNFHVRRAFNHKFQLRTIRGVACFTPTANENFVIVRIGAVWLG
jgi:hypothetical protein